MNDYRYILAVTDFSAPSRTAARRAGREAQVHSARLRLLHVIEHFPVGMPTRWVAPEDIDPAAYYRKQAAAELAELAGELGCPEASQSVVVTASSAGHAIADYAREREVDLVVAGVRGGWASEVLGSTAMAIMHHAPCDVLLVR